MCLAKGHNTVTPVRLKPAALRSQVKHSTTELPIVLYIDGVANHLELTYFCNIRIIVESA